MKIEKINDRQIRCTLTSEDLASRNINVKELAYGSDKAKELFQDMMQVAAQDFGFEADNIPLVIEAIPLSMDTIILIITKVEDPEELDTRFARFSPEEPGSDTGISFADLKAHMEGADDILDLIKRISEGRKRASGNTLPAEGNSDAPENVKESDPDDLANLMRTYSFRTLDDAIRAASVLDTVYDGPNTLYKNPEDNVYYLLLKKASSSPEQFNKICNILSEYAAPCRFLTGMEAYFHEHFEVILSGHALQSLKELS
ncbi:MAG: adaptor protein MecA [Clostridiales bacterium]|nr:adaptor protein MecA [Clostridiales bacterium]